MAKTPKGHIRKRGERYEIAVPLGRDPITSVTATPTTTPVYVESAAGVVSVGALAPSRRRDGEGPYVKAAL